MKRFRIIGIIAFIAMIANIIINFDDGVYSFKEGYDEGARMESGIPENFYRVSLEVKPIMGIGNDSIYVEKAGEKVPYWTNEITTYAQPSEWTTPIMICMVVCTFVFFYGFYCLIRLLIAVSRRNVFCKQNVWYIRFFVYSYAALMVCTELFSWFVGHAALSQVRIPGYQIINHAEASPAWLPIIMMIVLAECFAAGVKMKEEHDLTV